MNWGIRDAAARDLFLVVFQKWEMTMRATFSCCTKHELAEMEHTSAMQKRYSHTMLSYELYRITAVQFEETLSKLIIAMEQELVDVATIVAHRDEWKRLTKSSLVQRTAKA